MLEKHIEKAVSEYAKSQGVLSYKFTSPARAAVPDRLFINTNGKVWFCEFKRLGQKPTPAQKREHDRLENANVVVFVIDDIIAGKGMIDLMKGAS